MTNVRGYHIPEDGHDPTKNIRSVGPPQRTMVLATRGMTQRVGSEFRADPTKLYTDVYMVLHAAAFCEHDSYMTVPMPE